MENFVQQRGLILYLLFSFRMIHLILPLANRSQKEKFKTNQYGEHEIKPIMKLLVLMNIILSSLRF